MKYLEFILKRAKEPSTWAALSAVSASIGAVGFSTGFGAVAVFLREKGEA